MTTDIRVYEHYMKRAEMIAECALMIEDRAGGETITTRQMWDSAAEYLETAIMVRCIKVETEEMIG